MFHVASRRDDDKAVLIRGHLKPRRHTTVKVRSRDIYQIHRFIAKAARVGPFGDNDGIF